MLSTLLITAIAVLVFADLDTPEAVLVPIADDQR
jgi:hypothetical protein